MKPCKHPQLDDGGVNRVKNSWSLTARSNICTIYSLEKLKPSSLPASCLQVHSDLSSPLLSYFILQTSIALIHRTNPPNLSRYIYAIIAVQDGSLSVKSFYLESHRHPTRNNGGRSHHILRGERPGKDKSMLAVSGRLWRRLPDCDYTVPTAPRAT